MSPGPAAPLADAAARTRIEVDGLHELLFVEAGAGSGKTHELVTRVVGLVHAGIPLREIAAITFTEAAASELRDRVREALERGVATATDNTVRARCEAGLADADIAAISTLHAFAARILSEHPVEIGLPPRVDVLDEVRSELEFEQLWQSFVDALLADPDLEEVVTRAVLLGVRIDYPHGASLRDVARVFAQNWDRLDSLVREAAVPGPLDRTEMADAVSAVRALWPLPQAPADRLVAHLTACRAEIDELAALLAGASDTALVRRLRTPIKWKHPYGQAKNWDGDIVTVKATLGAADDAWAALKARAIDGVLRALAVELARFTLGAAEARRAEGRLEFHDLLVLARHLLRTSAPARRALHERYTRLLLDEFQDTDPIQIELAVLIAKTVEPGEGEVVGPWAAVAVELERLFFVGDPKQSIYRFRRADIELFLAARDAFAGVDPLHLVTNFRSVPTILGWVNHVFGQVMAIEEPGRQPAYEPLVAHRADGTGDHRVALLGAPHDPDEGLRADALRELEAADVAAAIDAIRRDPEAWPVYDKKLEAWRAARLEDVAILLPTRTSLPMLRAALEHRRIAYRAETGVLVYESQEVRDLLAILRVVADPTDEIALVAALRSPALACGDDDLWEHLRAGGHWDVRRAPPAALGGNHPVAAALEWLRTLHDERWWLEPSALLERVIRERRCFELAFAQPRPRDVWRRLRFLVDQARLFSESQGGDLIGFLEWTDLQRRDAARVHEPMLPEPDDEAVRILTVHGAKGLEFPITVLSGLTTAHTRRRNGIEVHWPTEGGIEIRLGKGTETDSFDRLADLEAEMDQYEKQRLLYVACTRARDYLFVAAHHVTGNKGFAATLWESSQDVHGDLCRVWHPAVELPLADAAEARTAPDLEAEDRAEARAAWSEARRSLLEPQRRSRSISPTAIARSAAAPAASDPGLAADADDLVADEADPSGATPWRPGRAGTAVGRAVHAVLESVDLATGAGTDGLASVQATLEGIPERAQDVAALVRRALASPIVKAAASGEHWRECYVAAPAGDRVLEGYVDLLARTVEGLVVVDYKTDTVRDEREADERVARYGLQAAAYAVALEASTGLSVVDCVFVFTSTEKAIERRVADLGAAKAEVRAILARGEHQLE